MRNQPLLQDIELRGGANNDDPTGPYDAHYVNAALLPAQQQMDSLDNAERLAREIQAHEESSSSSYGRTPAEKFRQFKNTMYQSLCLCKWKWPESGGIVDINKWRRENSQQHQYHRAPPNTSLGDFLDRTEHAIESESVVTILEANDGYINKNNLFSDDLQKIRDSGTALEAELDNKDNSYFERQNKNVAASGYSPAPKFGYEEQGSSGSSVNVYNAGTTVKKNVSNNSLNSQSQNNKTPSPKYNSDGSRKVTITPENENTTNVQRVSNPFGEDDNSLTSRSLASRNTNNFTNNKKSLVPNISPQPDPNENSRHSNTMPSPNTQILSHKAAAAAVAIQQQQAATAVEQYKMYDDEDEDDIVALPHESMMGEMASPQGLNHSAAWTNSGNSGVDGSPKSSPEQMNASPREE